MICRIRDTQYRSDRRRVRKGFEFYCRYDEMRAENAYWKRGMLMRRRTARTASSGRPELARGTRVVFHFIGLQVQVDFHPATIDDKSLLLYSTVQARELGYFHEHNAPFLVP